MSASNPASKVSLSQLGGLGGFIRHPGLVLHTLRTGSFVGVDAGGNHYFEQRKPASGKRARRWVVYASIADASVIPPHWHAWLHYLTNQPLPETGAKPWQLPHQPNLTGTQGGYRPSGHDYAGGVRAPAAADYESWTPDN